jgi:hypothetical protein
VTTPHAPFAMSTGRVPRDGRPMRIQARIAWALLVADALAFVALCKFVDFRRAGHAPGHGRDGSADRRRGEQHRKGRSFRALSCGTMIEA